MGIDWSVSPYDGTSKPVIGADGKIKKPVLILFPGLGGGADNSYTISLETQALKRGYCVGSILFRGAQGLPLTSGLLSCARSSDDARVALEFVQKKYIWDKDTHSKRTRIYAYGCSLGAQILGLYLIDYGNDTHIDGAGLYSAPWDTRDG